MTLAEELIQQGHEKGRAEGRTEGRTEGRAESLRRMLRKLLTLKFGSFPVEFHTHINTADERALEGSLERILTATSAATTLGLSPR
jgi:predicted transposase YdaD